MREFVTTLTLGALGHHKLIVAISYDFYRGQCFIGANRWEDSCPAIAPDILLNGIRIESAEGRNPFYQTHWEWAEWLETIVFNHIEKELEDRDSPLYLSILQYEEADGSLYV